MFDFFFPRLMFSGKKSSYYQPSNQIKHSFQASVIWNPIPAKKERKRKTAYYNFFFPNLNFPLRRFPGKEREKNGCCNSIGYKFNFFFFGSVIKPAKFYRKKKEKKVLKMRNTFHQIRKKCSTRGDAREWIVNGACVHVTDNNILGPGTLLHTSSLSAVKIHPSIHHSNTKRGRRTWDYFAPYNLLIRTVYAIDAVIFLRRQTVATITYIFKFSHTVE